MYTIREMDWLDLIQVNHIRNECAHWLHNPDKFDQYDTDQWFQKERPRWWVIVEKPFPDRVIGYFRTSRWNNAVCHIGADIHFNWRGKGIASEMYPQFIDMLFNDYEMKGLILEVLDFNTRAYNLYKKLGFKEVYRKRDERRPAIDSITMAITRDEWQK